MTQTIKQNDSAPPLSPLMSTEEIALTLLEDAVLRIKSVKPNDRSERDRKFSIVITELEKVQSIAKDFLR